MMRLRGLIRTVARAKMAAGTTEERLGITEFTTQGVGINGVLKQRFRDFVVNEVDMKGHVVELTQPAISFYHPSDKKPALEFTVRPEVREQAADILGPEGLAALETLEENVLSGNLEKVAEFPCSSDKTARTRMHQFIKDHFPALTSSTVLFT